SVCASDYWRIAELARALGNGGLERSERVENAVEGARDLQRERGVDNVARRQAVVHPRARRRTDSILYDVNERGNVVVSDLFALVDRSNVKPGTSAYRVGVGLRNHAQRRPRFDRKHFDFEPGAEARLVGEQFSDLGEGVTGDHGSAWAAM